MRNRLKAPPRIGFDNEASEKPARMMALDALSAFVPALEFAVRLAHEKADAQKRAFLPTDMGTTVQFARQLEALARHLDVRKPL